MGVRAQLSPDAIGLWGERIRAVVPEVELVAFDADLGRIPGDPPEVGWLSVDVLRNADKAFIDALIAAAPLRFVQSAGAGYDTWHFQQLLARGVQLCTAHVNNVPIAEFVLREVLDRFQRADRWRAGQASHHWEHHEWREVMDSTWLVIGVGAIGSAVAERARAFGAHVVGVRRSPDGTEPVDEMIAPDARPRSGCPTPTWWCSPSPAATRPATWWTPTSSPPCAPTRCWSTSRAGRSSTRLRCSPRSMPVAPTSPSSTWWAWSHSRRDSPLWDHPRIVVTPHSSSGGHGRFARGADLFAANLRRYLTGEPLRHEVVL